MRIKTLITLFLSDDDWTMWIIGGYILRLNDLNNVFFNFQFLWIQMRQGFDQDFC